MCWWLLHRPPQPPPPCDALPPPWRPAESKSHNRLCFLKTPWWGGNDALQRHLQQLLRCLLSHALFALQVNMTELQEVVAGYISCIVLPVPGYSCPLALSIMNPNYDYNKATGVRSYAPKQYIGVLQYMPELQTPLGKSNLARFLWNVMAMDSSNGVFGDACDPFQKKCPAGQVRTC